MKKLTAALFTAILSFSASGGNLVVTPIGEFFRIEASPEHGFHHPFFLYVPAERVQAKTLLVAPNNTSSLAELETQVEDALRKGFADAYIAERTKSILLVPAFPRPNIDPPIYTHALSRSALIVKEGPLQRVDLQLIAMIDAARNILKSKYKLELKQKVFLTGFSASASFVSRFSFLHPELVAAAAVGAPGGWPIAPVSKYKGQALSYPVGINDVKDLTGKEIDLKSLKSVSFFFYIGDKDENDSVTFRDSFSTGDEQIVMRLFGKKPVERWPRAKELYRDTGMQASFKIYPGIPHEVTRDMREDIIRFFDSVMAKP
jgi:predicted esterase